MRGGKLSFTTRFVLLSGILLFVANTVLGLVILDQSKSAMRELINKNMLDVVNSAAGSLDGDVLGALTKKDVDGPEFCDIERRLLVFQNSVDIQFIYAVKQQDDGRFVFTVDPDPVDPGAFGEEVLTTPALIEAGRGVPSVDSASAADRWGNYYSAFSPVLDSKGRVAGVVGVDFDATWYDTQVLRYSVSIAVVTALSVLTGAVVTVFITRRVRTKFRELDEGLSELSRSVDQLMDEMASYPDFLLTEGQPDVKVRKGDADELEILGDKICMMQSEVSLYLSYLRTQAYTDSLTGVGNSTAYHEAVDELDKKIAEGTADFWVLVFDVNSLKELNDTYGHECGDEYIKGTASALVSGMGDASVYRIGGDEFAVIAEGFDRARLDEGLRSVSSEIESFNSVEQHPARLAVSRGAACFKKESDTCYRDVFSRADMMMYEDKREYYRTVGDRRRR